MAAAADDYQFLGPSPARNFQPIQLIFLNLPFERAATVAPGEIELHVSSAESNEIATTQGVTESTLKFETNRTVVGFRYGLAPDWEMSFDMPFVSRFGGFLDPLIDEAEYIFGVGNVERDLYPNNTFGEFLVEQGDTVLFHGRAQYLEPGDFWVTMKRQLRLGDKLPLLAFRAAFKAPTGRTGGVYGSGKLDLGAGVAAEYRAFRRLMLYLNMNFVYPFGPITAGDLDLQPIFTQSFAAEFAITRRFSALLHQAVYTSPMHGNRARLLDGTPVEIGFGANFAWTEWLGLQLLAIDNVSPVEPAADFTLMLGMSVKPVAAWDAYR